MVDLVDTHVVIDEKTILTASSWEIIDPVWWAGNTEDGPEAYEASLRPFSAAQRHVFAMAWYETEVNNGGHQQFYDNSAGIVWREALAGFDAASIPEVAALIEESARRLGGNPSLIQEERWKAMDQLQPDFEDLDKALYTLTDVEERVTRYIRRRPYDFVFDGMVRKPPER